MFYQWPHSCVWLKNRVWLKITASSLRDRTRKNQDPKGYGNIENDRELLKNQLIIWAFFGS